VIPIVGVFRSRGTAEQGGTRLRALGIPRERIITLTPQFTEEELRSVPTTQGEQPGMFKALGAVVGGAVGAGIVETIATASIPGVGPVLAIGLAAGAIAGAFTGGAIGNAAEKSVFGALPEQELFVYRDALQKGRTVVIASADNEPQAQIVRKELDLTGAESIDCARNMWWIGLRDVERERYETAGGNFEQDERDFRSGFEDSLRLENRGKSYEEARPQIETRHPDLFERGAFRNGYERGRAYLRALGEQQKSASHRGT
jgi:hypothetical protein